MSPLYAPGNVTLRPDYLVAPARYLMLSDDHMVNAAQHFVMPASYMLAPLVHLVYGAVHLVAPPDDIAFISVGSHQRNATNKVF